MATFTWTAKGDVGASYDGRYPSHYKKAYDNYYASNFTVLSESLLNNGKISYYISGNYNLDIDYKNIKYNDLTGALSYDGYTFELKQYGKYIGTGQADGYFVDNLFDLSTIGYLTKDRTYYAETGIEEIIKGTFDYEYLGESLNSQRIYYISGDDTFNG